jgi:hypothetical protein
MTGSTGTRTHKVRCPAVTAVGDADMLRLATIAESLHPDDGLLGCELVAGHDGSHVALVATANDGGQWWWLRWDRLSEVIHLDPCAAELPHGGYADDCFLPDGHSGPHSFDLPPLRLPARRPHSLSDLDRTP